MKNKLYLISLSLILLSNVKTTFAQVSNSLYFDGSDDRITIPHIVGYNLGLGTFTFELVIKANVLQAASYPPLLTNRTGNGSNGFLVYLFSGQLATQTNGANLIATGTNLLDGNCHHIAITRNNDVQKTLTYYIDGVAVFTNGDIQDITTSTNWFIGYDVVTDKTFGGLIKEVRVWNTCRTTTEVTNNMSNHLSGTETGLIGYWRLDSGASQAIPDLSLSNNAGVLGSNSTIEPLDPGSQNGCPIATTGSLAAYGNTTFCTGGDVLLTATAPMGSTFQWKKNGVNITNASTYKYTANSIGTYTCLITTSGVATLSNGIYVNVLTNPSNFVVNTTGATSFCAGSSAVLNVSPTGNYTYQWFRGNLGIQGATSSTYTASNPGSYKAIVTNTQNNCIRSSASKSIAVTCREIDPNLFSGALEHSKHLDVYPNPANRSFMIELNQDSEINEMVTITMENLTGQKVFETKTEIVNGILQYQLNTDKIMPDGIYTLTVYSSQNKYVSKVVIN